MNKCTKDRRCNCIPKICVLLKKGLCTPDQEADITKFLEQGEIKN